MNNALTGPQAPQQPDTLTSLSVDFVSSLLAKLLSGFLLWLIFRYLIAERSLDDASYLLGVRDAFLIVISSDVVLNAFQFIKRLVRHQRLSS